MKPGMILFGLPRRFAQERAAIDARWRALQAEVHPDRFASEGAAAQRVAVQYAVRVNEAYQRLKDPLRRAKVRAFAMALACDTHPVQNLKVLARLRQLGLPGLELSGL